MDLCSEYIDRHVYEKIDPKELARICGYSYFHFCRIFRIWFDFPVCVYIRRRRLELAVVALRNGRKVIDVALDCGFHTAAGFSRAFRREFGMSATDYKKYGPDIKTKGNNAMQIIDRPGFKAVGYKFCPENPGAVDMLKSAAYWYGKDFSKVAKEDYARLATPNNGDVGMWYHEDKPDAELFYFFGAVVSSFDYVPDGMTTLELAGGKYAVFGVDVAPDAKNEEKRDAVREMWKYIFKEWLESSEYALDDSLCIFEFYKDSDTQICVPVKAR